jgi:hypothetical protein
MIEEEDRKERNCWEFMADPCSRKLPVMSAPFFDMSNKPGKHRQRATLKWVWGNSCREEIAAWQMAGGNLCLYFRWSYFCIMYTNVDFYIVKK